MSARTSFDQDWAGGENLKLSVPTVTSALETLIKLKIVKESTGKRRDRLFAYPRYLRILSEGTEPLKK